MEKIIFATNNKHKLGEVQSMLGDGYQVLSLADIGCTDDIPETADPFEGNALQKASWVHDRYGYDCIADDSGLEVDALGGEPGVFSARFAGKHGDDAANNALLLKRMQGQKQRSARFRCVIAYVAGDTAPRFFEGTVEGEIMEEPSGRAGFGYDPLFRPAGWSVSCADATPEEKNAISHRGQAVAKLVECLSAKSN